MSIATQAPQSPDPGLPDTDAPVPRDRHPGRLGNRLFSGISTSAGIVILATLAAVAIFLLIQAEPALRASADEIAGESITRSSTNLASYIAPLLFGTVLSAVLAMIVAVPLSVGIALFIAQYAPRRIASTMAYLIDLLAAIPSVVYGLWGVYFLLPAVNPVFAWLSETLGFIPLFADYQAPARNVLSASLVLAVMCLPIITAVSREVFLQTPRLHIEASLALGATKWEMIRQAVLPFGRSGVVSASMLGLGRALGETMAVLMVISPGFLLNFYLLKPGQHQSIAANIAAQFPEASGLSTNILIATGLALFVLTLGVNMLARWIVSRRAEFSGAN